MPNKKSEPVDAVVVTGDELELTSSPLEGPTANGVTALAEMPDDLFEAKLAAMKAGQERIARVKRELMAEDVHYGVIPGTKKPTLLKPGAEVLCMIYGLRGSFSPRLEYGDGISSPAVRAVVECRLHVGDTAGAIVAIGYGSANTWERRHRYRRGDRSCPECQNVGTIIKGKQQYGGGWICWAQRGGCGAKFQDNDPAITQQVVGDIENEDPHELENTVLKVAEKRAYVDATLRGTASSDLFTQDREPNGKPPAEGEQQKAKASGGQQKREKPIEQPKGKERADGTRAPEPGNGAEISELHEARALFVEGDAISKSQQGRLFNLAKKNGWTNIGVTDEMMRCLMISVEQIPKLGDAYPAIVSWFQRNKPAS